MKNLLKKSLAKIFHLGQHLGVDLLPRHFYSEVPDFRRLKSASAWRQRYSMRSVAGADVDRQLANLQMWFRDVDRQSLPNLHTDACRENGVVGYGAIESQTLYAFVRHQKPCRIVQVGAGVGTAICLRAARDAGYRPTITCVDPYPSKFLERADVRLIAQPVEDLDQAFVDELTTGDFFFVDSTHTLGPAGECTRIICELLPRLQPGVHVHFHDIFLPFDFSPRLMKQVFFWHETALLLAFLTLNPAFEIQVALSMLHHDKSNELRQLFADYHPEPMCDGLSTGTGDFPSSLYLLRRNYTN